MVLAQNTSKIDGDMGSNDEIPIILLLLFSVLVVLPDKVSFQIKHVMIICILYIPP